MCVCVCHKHLVLDRVDVHFSVMIEKKGKKIPKDKGSWVPVQGGYISYLRLSDLHSRTRNKWALGKDLL